MNLANRTLRLVWLFTYRMCEGEKRKLVIPSDMGYGDKGAPPKIPGKIMSLFHYFSRMGIVHGLPNFSEHGVHIPHVQ